MCGIAALWDPSQAPEARRQTIERMTRRIRHRGPDGEGFWSAEGHPLALGHRRLAIQGLGEQGAQPMVTPDGRGVLIYNGELFDAGGLRREIEQAGVRLRGSSDTELLLQALALWGCAAALARIKGQFAFAWYDTVARRLAVARDPVGIRPVYYAEGGGRLAVASEQKALVALGWVDRSPVPEAMLRYLLLQRTDDVPGETMLRGVRSLPAGHWAEWDGTRLDIHRYHRLDADPPLSTTTELRGLLDGAVGGQLVGEVPLGVMVSGGLDSSAVALLADARRVEEGSTETLHLFAYHDQVAEADERPYQQAVIEAVRSPHEVHWVSSSPARMREDFETYLDHQEEPYGDASSYAEFCIAREARASGVKVLLNGLGGDEVFAGYTTFFGPLVLDTLRAGEFEQALTLLRVAPRVLGRNGLGSHLVPLAAAAYHALPGRLRNVATAVRSSRLEGYSLATAWRTARDAWEHWHPHDGEGATNAALRGSIESWCVPRFLAHSDRMGLAHGVENRVPLLDAGVVASAYGIPPAERVSEWGLKTALRRAVEDLLPPLVRERAWKLGFHVPLGAYVAALEEPLREGHRIAKQALPDDRRWEQLGVAARWRWGNLGAYLAWTARQAEP